MKRLIKAEALLALTLLAAAGFSGCAAEQQKAKADTPAGVKAYEDPTRIYAWKDGEKPAQPAPAQPAPRATSGNGLAIPTGDKATSVLWLEKIYPAEVIAGQTFNYDIKVTNLTRQFVDNVTVYDTLPANFKIASATPQGQPGPNSSMVWALGGLNGGESKLIHLTGSAAGVGQIASCASATFTTALCSTINVVQPALKLAKTAPAEVGFCDPIPVRLVVSNNGNAAAKNVKVTDTLPAGLKTSDGKSTVDFDAGTLAPGASREFSFTLKADRAGSYNNAATAVSDGGVKADSNTTATKVNAAPTLAFKVECPGGILMGREALGKYTVTNTGDVVANNVVITAQVPKDGVFSKADTGGALSGGNVVWNIGNLNPRDSKTVTMLIRGGLTEKLVLTGSASATCATAVRGECTTTITGVPDIESSISDDNGVVLVGDNHNFVYTLKNQGQVNLTGIVVTCVLSDGLQYVSSTADVQPTVNGNEVTFKSTRVLKPGENYQATLVVKGTKPGEFTVQTTTSTNEIKTKARNDGQVTYVDR